MYFRQFVFVCFLFVILEPQSFGQVVNCNPDPNGPVFIGGDAISSPVDAISCQTMIPDPFSTQLTLPSSIDNSDFIYFPYIKQQYSGSCVHFAEIWYTFTYEINRIRGLNAGDLVNDSCKCNRYHPHFTYNFVNDGVGQGTPMKSGFGTIVDNGIPSYDLYDDDSLDNWATMNIYWMSGFDKYYDGMDNTISHCENIYWDSTYESMNLLKHWLFDHNEGDHEGGLAVFNAFMDDDCIYDQFPTGTPEEGQEYIIQWGTESDVSHAMTIVGYNDDVCCFDLDNNGTYTNSDLDGDGLELSECERGAFIVANSWGIEWKNGGFFYVPYKLFGEGLPVGDERAYVCHAKASEDHELAIKTKIEYPNRKLLSLHIGCASDVTSTSLENIQTFQSFIKQGGPNPMHAPYSDEIEIGLNFDHFYHQMDFGKVYLEVNETDSDVSNYEGTVNSFTLVDNRWGENFEIDCEQVNVPIQNRISTYLSINYDLLPHHDEKIDSDLLLYSDMVSRFEPTVTNNSTLTVSDITIDMYESTITIEEGSSLVVKDNSVFDAKKGNCEIIINGNVQIGDNVRFIAQSEASLDIHVTDPDVILKINNCVFENCQLNSNAESDSITNSNFLNSNIICHNIKKENYESAIISNNNFSDGNKIAIDLSHFNTYSIENNTIDNMKTGIMLNLCGDDKPLIQNIYNNDITNCSSAGIHLLESRSYISENYVGHCGEGVRLESRSYTAIYGNPNASDYSEMNRIFNEDSYEFYISKNSFPWYFHYNAIIDNDNGGNSVDDPLIYYDNANDLNQQSQKDVRYNCWGSGFSASSDLFPAIDFDYLPTYCPPLPPSQSSPVETLYQNSLDQFTAEDYADSKAGFMFIVDQYPETKYAQSAMCELVPLEKYADNDYLALQNYFLTNTTIQSDTILAPLASKLANECDIELQNYSVAINYFEGVIADPADTQDSIYAIIDLGYLYETMGSGNKASVAGKMPQYKPKSIKQFNNYKLDLLSLLPVKKGTQTGQNEVDILEENGFTIRPNPVNEITTFGYKLKAEGYVQVKIFATDGTPIEILDEGYQNTGSHEVTYNSSSLDAGLYYCSLVVDGVVVETRKMVVVN